VFKQRKATEGNGNELLAELRNAAKWLHQRKEKRMVKREKKKGSKVIKDEEEEDAQAAVEDVGGWNDQNPRLEKNFSLD
jgi:hypothetical protein